MAFPRPLLWLSSLALLAAPVIAAQGADGCERNRKVLSNQIQEARLAGDGVRLTALEEQLLTLNTRCRGLVALQPNHAEIEAASRRVSAEEAALREALGKGDMLAITASQRRLDEARQALTQARRGEPAVAQ